MKPLLSLLVSTALANNFVLVKFLGLCPVMGVSTKVKNAVGLALATTFVLTLTAGLSSLVQRYILTPLDLPFLQLVTFIFLIAATVQGVELLLRSQAPLLHQVLGIYLPLITTNCAVLGVALLNVNAEHSFIEAVFYGLGTGIGFAAVLVLFATMRERLQAATIPQPFQGTPIALITIGIFALGFMGFAGLGY